ncbi:NAD(P)/FAD-dependent oxidoreductase [Prochlorococcus sp. MIT 1300]|uniref:NAD(P)/FAD-dependent oxidoreductase n=1 Tax=Prochlorococcus sp. MIT 1300 TaxID=3096218 RepID=UPI002A747A8A|nr:NAD(P)/FAD-dependent oxidoreductase [Prochlorococcus sp. MIT 1300]
MSILIAGAGPSGARLAEKLSNEGISVTIADRLKAPTQSSFSSAAVPISAIRDHDIPEISISEYWNCWRVRDPSDRNYEWSSNNNLGVVLDFSILRNELWHRAKSSGVELLLGWTVKDACSKDDHVDVELLNPFGERSIRKFQLVVDATGSERALLKKTCYRSKSSSGTEILEGVGIEWIIQADLLNSQIWGKRVTFFLGSRWITHGYGWIFPMSGERLKVGVCRLPPPDFKAVHSMSIDLKNLLKANGLDSFPVIERHGGVLNSSINRSEPHLVGRIVGVGDAVSTANLLGGEGIRYALASAELLAPLLISAISSSNSKSLEKVCLEYRDSLRHLLGWRWNISGRIARKTWWGLSGKKADSRLEKLLDGLGRSASADDLSALLFDYRFERYGIRLIPYLLGWR